MNNVIKKSFDSLSSYDKKACHALYVSAMELIGDDVNSCAFVTLTTPDNYSYWTKEGWESARKIFRSFISNKSGFNSVFGSSARWVRIIEPQKRGAIHWHLLVKTEKDIRTGCNLKDFDCGNYSSASPVLRQMWSRLRLVAPRYGFGRCEIMPLKSDIKEAVSRYLAKYLSKTYSCEKEFSKGGLVRPNHARRVGFSSGWFHANTKFSWVGDHSMAWRLGVEDLANRVGCADYSDLSEMLGKKWAWQNRKFIITNGMRIATLKNENNILKSENEFSCQSEELPF